MPRLPLLALLALGCAAPAQRTGEIDLTGTRAEVPPPEVAPPDEPFRTVNPREPVPPFRVTTVDGARIDSTDLVGKRAFALVFFASWCSVCDAKMAQIGDALEQAGLDVPVLAVSVDEVETWPDVRPLLERHQLDLPLIRGQQYARFALAYDPRQTVPVVAVVGRNGYLVDYQVGYAEGHLERLVQALRLAREIAPDARPH